MKRKYLDDIGFTDRPDLWNPEDKRQSEWETARAEYGFDERELWNMDLTFMCWLYERLKWFKEYAPINLNNQEIDYEGKIYTLEEYLDKLISLIESYLKNINEPIREHEGKANKAIAMWAIIATGMGW